MLELELLELYMIACKLLLVLLVVLAQRRG